jgi:lysozyme
MASPRVIIGALVISAASLVGIATYEGYEPVAKPPVPGDVPTLGFGATKDVKHGERTDPIRALIRLQADAESHATGIKSCIKVPLHQWEFDAYLSLAYNIGVGAFCRSTLVRKLNEEQYEEACKQILVWNKFQGRTLQGLVNRREKEYATCLGSHG